MNRLTFAGRAGSSLPDTTEAGSGSGVGFAITSASEN